MKTKRQAIVAILALGAVPTLFSIFPEWLTWSIELRSAIAVGWLAIALLLAVDTHRQNAQLQEFVTSQLEWRRDERVLAVSRAIRLILDPGNVPPVLRHYQLRLYLYDDELDMLLPSYVSPGEDVSPGAGWRPGVGVTGRAYETNEYVSCRGQSCSDGTYGLTPEQQRWHRDLAVVAAYPLRDDDGDRIGVLTASSTVDDGRLVSPEGVDAHIELATIIQRLLIDVLRRSAAGS